MSDIIKVWIYFTSGESEIVSFHKETFKDLVKELENNWDSVKSCSEEHGFTFKHVTHYKVYKES